jgi:hypothetical protein
MALIEMGDPPAFAACENLPQKPGALPRLPFYMTRLSLPIFSPAPSEYYQAMERHQSGQGVKYNCANLSRRIIKNAFFRRLLPDSSFTVFSKKNKSDSVSLARFMRMQRL